MLTPAGVVKVLDFGLAKGGAEAREGDSNPNLSASPTMTYAATQAGMVLGTAAYMSPEQARGKNVDRRTDIWSFGCVLFECLCGKPVFEGETISDLVARILEREPEWNALPARTPARLRDLLKRCMVKDPEAAPARHRRRATRAGSVDRARNLGGARCGRWIESGAKARSGLPWWEWARSSLRRSLRPRWSSRW